MKIVLEKPAERPSKRFVELPGGVRKRESERHGGPFAEKRRKKELHELEWYLKKGREEKQQGLRKSSGVHSVGQIPIVKKPVGSKPEYSEEVEKYRKQRLKEDLEETKKI